MCDTAIDFKNLPYPTHVSEWDRLRVTERREAVASLSCKCGNTHTDAEVLVLAGGAAHNLCPAERLYHRLRDPAAAKVLGCAWYDESGDVWRKAEV